MSQRRRLKNPPVVTVILTVQFTPALSALTMLDVVGVFDLFKDRYPVFAQINRAGPMIVNPLKGAVFDLTQPDQQLPRVAFTSEDSSRAIYFQDDRVSLSWSRQSGLDEPTDYPGYEGLRDSLLEEADRFVRWSSANNFPEVRPATAEVLYINAFRMDLGDRRRAMSEVFTFFNNPRKARMVALDFAWTEFVRPPELVAGAKDTSGLVHMQTSSGIAPTGKPVVTFQLTGTSQADHTWNEMKRTLDEVHDRIAEIFDAAIQDEVLQGDLP